MLIVDTQLPPAAAADTQWMHLFIVSLAFVQKSSEFLQIARVEKDIKLIMTLRGVTYFIQDMKSQLQFLSQFLSLSSAEV